MLTKTRTRCRAAIGDSDHVIASAAATIAKPWANVSADSSVKEISWTRIKNKPVVGSPNCWLAVIVQCRLTKNPDTAWTIPGRSAQDSAKTYSGASTGAIVPVGGGGASHQASQPAGTSSASCGFDKDHIPALVVVVSDNGVSDEVPSVVGQFNRCRPLLRD